MKLILTGKAMPEYEEKNIEIGGKPMLRILGPMQLQTGEILPVTVWGETKCGYWKQFAENGEEFSIVIELFAKSQTYTNHEGESTTVPFIQLKLYSYLNMPNRGTAYNSFVAGSTNLVPPPPQAVTAERRVPAFVADRNNVVPPNQQSKVPQWNVAPNYYGVN